jgi:hypothetical protein
MSPHNHNHLLLHVLLIHHYIITTIHFQCIYQLISMDDYHIIKSILYISVLCCVAIILRPSMCLNQPHHINISTSQSLIHISSNVMTDILLNKQVHVHSSHESFSIIKASL